MATFPKLREFIDTELGQNLNYLHVRKLFHAMLDLLAVATNTYSGGENIEITENGVINLVADEKTLPKMEKGYLDYLKEVSEASNKQ